MRTAHGTTGRTTQDVVRRWGRLASAVAVLTLAAACSWTPDGSTDGYQDVRFTKVDFASLPSIEAQDWAPALRAFRLSCAALGSKPVWKAVCEEARTVDDADAQRFFGNRFEPWQVARRVDRNLETHGLTTGYYEPELMGSRVRTSRYTVPVLAVPPDLVTVELSGLYPQLRGLRLRGKLVGRTVVPYDPRSGIAGRDDLDRNAICWVADPVEAAFLQVQGSGRVRLPDGSHVRVGYADTNGHPYRALGRWLIENAGLRPEEMSMQRIKAWAREHPRRLDDLLNSNPSYVFFTERIGFTDEQGPIGAQGVPLTTQASVAVDRRYWTLGMPMVVSVSQSLPPLSFTRPVVAQDTGGAIRGPLRFDFFWGYGDEAGTRAGRQKSDTRAWVLVPRGHVPSETR